MADSRGAADPRSAVVSSGAPESRGAARGWYVLALCVLIADQASKVLASKELLYAVPQEVFFWLNMTLHHNEGAAFSFLSDAGGWQRWFFAVLAVAVSTTLVVWLRQLTREQRWLALGLSLVLGGAIGNLVDRLRLGYVVDFISVHYETWYFPTFNVADAAISVGATLIVIDSIWPQGHTESPEPAAEAGEEK
ncbi:MAG: signal peptidase II [Pseudomonadota bacterium]